MGKSTGGANTVGQDAILKALNDLPSLQEVSLGSTFPFSDTTSAAILMLCQQRTSNNDDASIKPSKSSGSTATMHTTLGGRENIHRNNYARFHQQKPSYTPEKATRITEKESSSKKRIHTRTALVFETVRQLLVLAQRIDFGSHARHQFASGLPRIGSCPSPPRVDPRLVSGLERQPCITRIAHWRISLRLFRIRQ